jgi:hypothetical protein
MGLCHGGFDQFTRHYDGVFWKKTTAQGVIASVFAEIVAALGIILLFPDLYPCYGFRPDQRPPEFQPARPSFDPDQLHCPGRGLAGNPII